MKNSIKAAYNLLGKMASALLWVLWPTYMRSGNLHDPFLVLTCFVRQKIFFKNFHVPWPVHPTSVIIAPSKIKRGSRTPGLGISCFIDGRNGIILEENVWIGPRVSLISMNHNTEIFEEYLSAPPIVIRKNSWIAANAVILPGVEIGEHTIVAAGAIVTKSFPGKNQVLAGNPAHIVKTLPEYGAQHS